VQNGGCGASGKSKPVVSKGERVGYWREVPSVKGCRGLIVVKRQRGSVAYQGLRILEMGSSVGVGKINGKDKLLEYTVDLSLDFNPILHL